MTRSTRNQARRLVVSFLGVFVAASFLAGCGAVNHVAPTTPQAAVVITPASAQIRAGDTQQFSATVSLAHTLAPVEIGRSPSTRDPKSKMHGDASRPTPVGMATSLTSTGVTWSVNGVAGGNASVGMIDANGLYTAPTSVPAANSVQVTATSVAMSNESATAAVTLQNPIPMVTSVSPTTVPVGNFTLTIKGSKFVKGAQVMFGTTALQTTFVSSTQLTASGSAAQSQLGGVAIAVKNPDPGAVTSATTLTLQVSTASTVQVAVSPAKPTLRAGSSQQFTAAVKGSTNPAVTWAVNGVAGGNTAVGTITTGGLYTAPTKIPTTATVNVSAISVADTRASGAATVALQNPIPVLASISPTALPVGNFNLTVTGSNFVNGAVVVFGGEFLTTTFISSTQLSASGTALQQQVGAVSVAVQNPDPGSATSGTLSAQVNSATTTLDAMAAARLLEQSTWGPTQQSIAHVQQVGMQAFLNEQFSAPVSKYTAPAPTDDISFVEKQFFANSVNGQDQLRQRVAFALSEIFVISAQKISNPSAFVLWMNMMQNDAFSNYLTLLKDATLSPSMGNYLDMANNDGCSGCKPNENYAREVNQLFSVGLVQLNPDGTEQLDGSGNPIPTYGQDEILGFAHAFTGWTYPPAAGASAKFFSPQNYSGPMIAFDSHHDVGPKLLLNGVTLPGGGTTQGDMDAALQNIFNHPNVGPFISKQLIQKLVVSNPSADYVSRITAVFQDNGSGVRGDLKAVVTAILLDPEARRGDDPAQVQPSDGHLKEPLLFMMNLMRATNTTTDGGDNLRSLASNMKQEPFNSPTVFNFYPPRFEIQGTQLLGPEFKILNTSTDIARINFVNSLIYGSVGQTTKTNISSYVALAPDVNKLLDAVSAVMLHGQMSDIMRTTISNAITPITDNTKRTQAALYLVGSSSQFQVEH